MPSCRKGNERPTLKKGWDQFFLPSRSKQVIAPEALRKTTRFPSQTAGGAELSLKHPERRRGCFPGISRFQSTLPVEASQHHAWMSLPRVESISTGVKVVKNNFLFAMTGVLCPVSGNANFQETLWSKATLHARGASSATWKLPVGPDPWCQSADHEVRAIKGKTMKPVGDFIKKWS